MTSTAAAWALGVVALGASGVCLAGTTGSPGSEAAPASIVAELTLEPTALDFEGNKKAMQMYNPSSAALAEERPEGVRVEPQYSGKARYGLIRLGNAAPGRYVFALDEGQPQAPAGGENGAGEPRIFIDLNGDGDLTNDGTGAWPRRIEGKDGAPASYQGTFVFDVGWTDRAGTASRGRYGLNMYWTPGRDAVNFYRAGAATGSIDIAGKAYSVMLLENDNDGVFDKFADAPALPGSPLADAEGGGVGRSVLLLLDGNPSDVRGTFGFAGTNFMARVSPDGRRLELTPTARFVRVPRPAPRAGAAGGGSEQPELLQAGAQAPDFTVQKWNGADNEPTDLTLASFRGKKVVVIDFWATWCGPCMRGLPHFAKVAESAKGQDVVFLAVNVMDEAKPYEAFVSGKGKDMPVTFARDPAGRERGASIASRLFNVRGIPAQFVIGKDGKIVASISGYREGDRTLEDALAKAGVKLN
jgi:thiol-disulfide isomerase/thioredoxin